MDKKDYLISGFLNVSMPASVFNLLSVSDRKAWFLSVLNKAYSSISNPDYFMLLSDFTVGDTFSFSFVTNYGYGGLDVVVSLKSSTGVLKGNCILFRFASSSNINNLYCNVPIFYIIWEDVWSVSLKLSGIDFSGYVKPVPLPPIPDAVIPDSTYNGFLKDEKLFSSFVSLVDTVLKSLPESIQSFDNSVLNVVKTRTKGITLLDYYQAKIPLHETDTYNEGISVYKEMYLRVIAPSGTSVISRSIKVDWTLIQSMGYGSGILDNGVSIAGNAIIEKRKGPEGKEIETSYIRRAYTIHSNDFDISSWIKQVQKDNNYAPTLITFPDFEQINNDLSNQGNFFNGKDLQSSLKDRYNFYYNFLKQNQDVLGLSDSQIVTLANNRANADYFEYYNSKNNATMAQMATINTQIEKDRREQELSEKKLAEEEKAREEEEKEKEKDKAIEIAKKNDKEIKKKVVEYSSKVSVMFNKYSKVDSTSKGLGLPVDISEVTGSKVFSVFISQDTVEPSLLPFN